MSEQSGHGTRQPRRMARRPMERTATSAPDLTLLALMEGVAAAWRAGAPSPLADYARAYPQHADALADYAAALWSGEVAGREDGLPRAPLSAGTQASLARLFGGTAEAPAASARLVAEQPGEYAIREAARRETPPDRV